MTYAELPKLKKNSVPTTLSSGIDDSVTTIPVTELSVFYDVDSNLITQGIVIGYDSSDETYSEEITITGASGTSGAGNLTGATRGVNADGSIGAARAWDSGTKIAVMFSTGIYENIRANCDYIISGFYSEGVLRNAVINGGMNVAQRGTTFDSTTNPQNNDGNYLIDQWILLSDGDNITKVYQVEEGCGFAWEFEVVTANKKFGMLQIFPSETSQYLYNCGEVSVCIKQRGTGLSNLRAAVLAWNGTADQPTKDVVSAWNGAGTDPTLVSGWTYENTPTNIPVASTLTEIKIEGVSLDTSGTTNIGIFVWCDDADAVIGETLYIKDVLCCFGSICLPFSPLQTQMELILCQQFFWMPHTVLPSSQDLGLTVDVGDVNTLFANNCNYTYYAVVHTSGGGGSTSPIVFPTQMRSTPTATFYGNNNVAYSVPAWYQNINGTETWYEPSVYTITTKAISINGVAMSYGDVGIRIGGFSLSCELGV